MPTTLSWKSHTIIDQGLNVIATLRWNTKDKNVFVSYNYLDSQDVVDSIDLTNDVTIDCVKFCNDNGLNLWSY